MSNALEVLVPLYIYNQSFIEYHSSVAIKVMHDGTQAIYENPDYNASYFTSFMPAFKGLVEPAENEDEEDKPYHGLFKAYMTVANQKLRYRTFGSDWYLLMSNFIAHHIQLRLQEMANKIDNAVEDIEDLANLSQGVMTAGKAGDVSYTINNMLTDKMFGDAGEFNYTRYGKIFWSTYKRYAKLSAVGLY